MSADRYLARVLAAIERIRRSGAADIRSAADLVAQALARGGLVHVFGSGHSHLLAEEVFYRAGGLGAVNPIRDARLMMLEGVMASTEAERETGLADRLIAREQVEERDVAIVISNSGRNAVSVEMVEAFQARGVKVIAVTSLEHSRAVRSRHPSGRRLFEVADVVIDNVAPRGDASVPVAAGASMGPLSTITGAAILHAVFIEAASLLLERGAPVPVLPSANVEEDAEATLRTILAPYADRIRALDVS